MACGDPSIAWIDETEEFDPIVHDRFDDQLEQWEIEASEDGFATMRWLIQASAGGLLKSTRKVWAFLAITMADGSLKVLAKGKVDSFPLGGNPEECSLKFKCAPSDWQALQLARLKLTRSEAHWDPVLVAPESRDDPVELLDGQSRVVHFDPATHECQLHDIFGDDLPEIDIGLNWFEDSLAAEASEPPALYVDIEVTANWTQQVFGSFDVTGEIKAAFTGGAAHSLTDLDNRWPKKGDGITDASGYTVQRSSLVSFIPDDGRPTTETFQGSSQDYQYATDVNLTSPQARNVPLAHMYWDPDMRIGWSIEQARSETIKMRLYSGVQDTSLGNGGGKTISLTCQDITVDDTTPKWQPLHYYDAGDEVRQGGANWKRIAAGTSEATWAQDFAGPDMSTFPPIWKQKWTRQASDGSPLGGIWKSSYFTQVRGHRTLLAALMKGRAVLADSMRFVEITFEMPLLLFIELNIGLGKRLRMSIPEGFLAIENDFVVGKVAAYKLTSTAEEDVASVTLRCAAGSGRSTTGSGALMASLTGEAWDKIIIPDLSSLPIQEVATGGLIGVRVANTAEEQIAYIDARDFDVAAGRTNKDETNPERMLKDIETEIAFDLVPIAAEDEIVLEHKFEIPVPFEGPRQIDFGGPA